MAENSTRSTDRQPTQLVDPVAQGVGAHVAFNWGVLDRLLDAVC